LLRNDLYRKASSSAVKAMMLVINKAAAGGIYSRVAVKRGRGDAQNGKAC